MDVGEERLAVLEVVQGGDGAALGEVAEQVLAAGAGGDGGRDDAADAASGRGDRREPFGEQLVGLQRVDALDGQPLGAQRERPRAAGEQERGLDLAPRGTVAGALVRVLSLPLDDAGAPLLSGERGDGRLDLAEVLLVLEIDLVPGRVAEEAGEAAGPAGGGVQRWVGVVRDAEDVGELQVPVEEAVLGLEPGDLRGGGRRDRRGALLTQRPEDPVDDGGGCVLGLAPDEGGAPGVGDLVVVLVLR